MTGSGSLPVLSSRRAVLAGALLTAVSPLMAQNGRIRVRITDASGAAVAGANGRLLDSDGTTVQTALSGKSGELSFAGLSSAQWRINVISVGFKTFKVLTNLWYSKEIIIDARLEVGTVGTIVYVGPMPQTESLAVVYVRVRDPDGNVVSGGSATLLGANDKPERTVHATGSEIALRNLPMRAIQLVVAAPNLQSEIFNLTLPGDEYIQIEAILRANFVGEVVLPR